jgi:hypothetical protein
MERIIAFFAFLAALSSYSASAEENAAKEIMKLAPKATKFVDCVSLVEHLVDIDPPTGFDVFERKLGRQIADLPAARRSRVFMALEMAGEHNSKSILELGIADIFAPIFVLANKGSAECRQNGCDITIVESSDWFGRSDNLSYASSVAFGPLTVDRDSYVRVSDFIPTTSDLAYTDPDYGELLDFTIDYDPGAFFAGLPIFSRLVTIAGTTQDFHVGQFSLSPRCYDVYKKQWNLRDPNYPECDALLSLYEKFFDGQLSYDAALFESPLPIRVVSVEGPWQAIRRDRSNYCELPLR